MQMVCINGLTVLGFGPSKYFKISNTLYNRICRDRVFRFVWAKPVVASLAYIVLIDCCLLCQMGFEGRDRSRSPRRDGGGPPPRSFDDGGGGGGYRGGGGGGGGGGGDGDGCKLYIGNLAFSTQSEDLRQYFGQVFESNLN
jgi:hypothetical protein